MRVLVFGSRTFSDVVFLFETLDKFHATYDFSTVIEGEAPGADTLAREWAEVRHIDVEPYPARWEEYGRAAGPIRNTQMLLEGRPEMAFGFIDGAIINSKGSKNMWQQALKANIPTHLFQH